MAIHLQAKASFHVAFALDKQAQKGQHDVQAKASFLGATILVAPKAWMELSCHGCKTFHDFIDLYIYNNQQFKTVASEIRGEDGSAKCNDTVTIQTVVPPNSCPVCPVCAEKTVLVKDNTVSKYTVWIGIGIVAAILTYSPS